MAKRSRPQVEFAQVCLLLAIVWPVLIVADYATVMWIPERWTNVAYAVWGLYALAYCARGMQALSGNRQPVAVLGGRSEDQQLLGVEVGGVDAGHALAARYPAACGVGPVWLADRITLPNGVKRAFFKDPDGNTVELKGSPTRG